MAHVCCSCGCTADDPCCTLVGAPCPVDQPAEHLRWRVMLNEASPEPDPLNVAASVRAAMGAAPDGLTASQRKAVVRVLTRFAGTQAMMPYRLTVTFGGEPDCTDEAPRLLTLTATLDRTDCHPDSPRAVLCGERLFAFVTRRGAVEVVDYRCGTSHSEAMLKAVARLVGGRVSDLAVA